MPKPGATEIHVHAVPAALKAALADRASDLETSMSDAAVEILAARFRVRYVPNRRPATTKIDPTTTTMLLRDVPDALARKIRVDAARRGRTQRDVIVEKLSEELGVEFVSATAGRVAAR